MPSADMILPVATPGGDAFSDIFNADYLFNFSVKCQPGSTWQYEIVDPDGFGIYGEPDAKQGGYSAPINRKVAKSQFRLHIFNASADAYSIRVGTGA